MKTYEFTLFLAGVEIMTQQLASQLFEAGCDEGTPKSVNEAISSAIADVENAGVKVDHVELDNEEFAVLRT